MKRRALISVSNKNGVAEFARELYEIGFEIISTGGTARTLAEAQIPVVPVSKVTGAPEMLGGRVQRYTVGYWPTSTTRPRSWSSWITILDR